MIEILYSAVPLFNHNFQEVHNKLVVSGADKVLVACLDSAVADPSLRTAIDPTCRLITMIFRCGDAQFQDSMSIVGGDLFPPLLATLFLNESETPCPVSAFSLMRRLNQVRLDLRDVPWSRSLLSLFREAIMVVDPCENLEPLSFVMTWLVDGLLLQSDHNKFYLMEHPKFFDAVVDKFSSTFRPGRHVNHQVAKFTKFLALATVNRAKMVEKVNFFCLLFLLSHDDSVECRGQVLETLKLVALDRGGRHKVMKYLEHKFVDVSVEALQDRELQNAALQLILILATSDAEKVLLSRHPELLTELTSIVYAQTPCSLLAAQVAARLTANLSVHNGKANALNTVLRLCSSENPLIRREGACVLWEQARKSQACSFFIVHVPEALATITAMAADIDLEVRAAAIEIVVTLASNPLNVRALASSRELLSILAESVVAPCDPTFQHAKKQAIVSILRLVVHRKSLAVIAKQENIVRSLAEYGESAEKNDRLKQAALRGVASLTSYS